MKVVGHGSFLCSSILVVLLIVLVVLASVSNLHL
jgi:hypothetical protein